MAIVGTFPSPVTNGTTEDATQVMSLFSFIQSQVNSNACPKTTGGSILKGDNAGGTTSAAGGTDYYAPSGGAIAGRAYTTPQSVAFSGTPTFDVSLSNVIYFGALTANVTAITINNPVDGQTVNIRFVQDATGGRTVALPASVHATGAMQTGANSVSWLSISYVNSASRWEGAWMAVP